jgi:hypothetical protein
MCGSSKASNHKLIDRDAATGDVVFGVGRTKDTSQRFDFVSLSALHLLLLILICVRIERWGDV